MNKNRYINTSFWEDEYVGNLSSDEKLLFIYLLTSQLSNIAGMYPITIRRITFDTGMTKERIINAFDTFKSSRKILFIGQKFVVITNFIKHQKWNPNIQKGIIDTVNSLPEYVKLALDMDLDKPFKSFTSLLNALNYSNSNSNSNSNINIKEKDIVRLAVKNETDEKTKDIAVIPFIKFWYLYDMKKAMADCKDYWDGNKKLKTKKYITNSDRKLCIKNLPAYVKNTHKNGTYPSRKDPKTYLYNSSWNDEIIYGNESAEDKSDREVVERMRKQGTLK
jgi:hypothetical protein